MQQQQHMPTLSTESWKWLIFKNLNFYSSFTSWGTMLHWQRRVQFPKLPLREHAWIPKNTTPYALGFLRANPSIKTKSWHSHILAKSRNNVPANLTRTVSWWVDPETRTQPFRVNSKAPTESLQSNNPVRKYTPTRPSHSETRPQDSPPSLHTRVTHITGWNLQEKGWSAPHGQKVPPLPRSWFPRRKKKRRRLWKWWGPLPLHLHLRDWSSGGRRRRWNTPPLSPKSPFFCFVIRSSFGLRIRERNEEALGWGEREESLFPLLFLLGEWYNYRKVLNSTTLFSFFIFFLYIYLRGVGFRSVYYCWSSYILFLGLQDFLYAYSLYFTTTIFMVGPYL